MKGTVRAYRLLLLVAAMVLATFALGWWAPLFVAVIFAIIDSQRTAPAEAGAGAAIAWTLLFVLNALLPGAGIVTTMGRAMGLPALVLPVVTLVFPMLLAWSGATVAVGVLHVAGRPRHAHPPAPAAVSAPGE